MPVLRKHEKYCEDVRRLSEAGLSDSEIAEHFGVVTRTVAKWRKRYCIPPELRSTQKIIRAHNAGLVAQKKGKTPNGRRMWKVVL